MRALNRFELFPFAAGLLIVGACTGGGKTSAGSSGGSSGSSTTSTGGDGTCDAGMMCKSAADCPKATTACKVPACSGGCCNDADAPFGTKCTDNGGKACVNGACVACITPADCPTPTTACKVAICGSQPLACSTQNTPKLKACSDSTAWSATGKARASPSIA
jgi:hypothetical protein